MKISIAFIPIAFLCGIAISPVVVLLPEFRTLMNDIKSLSSSYSCCDGDNDIVDGTDSSNYVDDTTTLTFRTTKTHVNVFSDETTVPIRSNPKTNTSSKNNNQTITPLEQNFQQLFTDDGLHFSSSSDVSLTPVMWHIPKAGGSSLKGFVACLNLTVACQAGKYNYKENGGRSSVNNHPTTDILYRKDFGYYVNVDVSSQDGIQASHDVGFAERLRLHTKSALSSFSSSSLVSSSANDIVIVTTFIQTAARLLFEAPIETKSVSKGILLAVLRDPIDRQVPEMK
jgi:hypothetical protein